MPKATLEQRVAALEEQVARLKKSLSKEKDWRRTLGMFANDPIMKEIDEETLKIREADRQRAQRKRTTARR
jgi:hypothetical protein